jgi:phage terminase large subunit-like protein
MAKVSPSLHRPKHFAKYIDYLERAPGGGLRVVFSAPPQHGKTECTLHGLVWVALKHPKLRHAYITYSQQRSRIVARRVRRLLADCGVVVEGTLDEMLLPGGGQILFTSIDGGLTGNPVDGIAVIDDYLKNRKEADSARRREVVLEAEKQAIETRVHPKGSVIVLATRWHPQDLSGTLKEEGWTYLNLPAIAEENDTNGREVGEALFPEMWSISDLLLKKTDVGEFTWAALYQGRPRPKGGKVFHEPTWYTKLPEAYRGAYGIDLAATAKTNADWSICLELLRAETSDPERPLFYVRHVDRAQVEAPSFALTLKARSVQRRGWRMMWRACGMEKGAAQFIQKQGIPVVVEQPPGDKLVSATAVSAAWNDHRVLVPDPEVFPDAQKWLFAFLDIVGNFTGTGKEHDDDVDALGNAHALLSKSSGMQMGTESLGLL